MADQRDQIIAALITSYRMELETVMNYLANSINLDGVRAEEIIGNQVDNGTRFNGFLRKTGLPLVAL
ncbi:MAG: hypothetical protein KJZ87_12180, partial [Thermoguttaceae bacterium]|nr:hypothetical protein [Thermoguttaceae bacterium]